MKTLLLLAACIAIAVATGIWTALKLMAFLLGAVPIAASLAKLAATLICLSVAVMAGLLICGIVIGLCGIVLTIAGALD